MIKLIEWEELHEGSRLKLLGKALTSKALYLLSPEKAGTGSDASIMRLSIWAPGGGGYTAWHFVHAIWFTTGGSSADESVPHGIRDPKERKAWATQRLKELASKLEKQHA